jgi:hypothetical protein
LGEVVGDVEAVSLRARSQARSVRARPPRMASARSARSKAAWGLGMGIGSEGRVFRYEGAVGCNLREATEDCFGLVFCRIVNNYAFAVMDSL